jgi:hypothetical protein
MVLSPVPSLAKWLFSDVCVVSLFDVILLFLHDFVFVADVLPLEKLDAKDAGGGGVSFTSDIASRSLIQPGMTQLLQ